MTPKQLHILQHALGCDQYGRGNHYRNYYVTGPGSDNFTDCRELVESGLMQDRGANSIAGGDNVFQVTQAGKEAIIRESQPVPQVSRSRARYHEWLSADCGMRFGEWLKMKQRNKNAVPNI